MALSPFNRVQNPEPVFACGETPEAFFVTGERADPLGRDLARFAGHGLWLYTGTRGCPYVAACGVLAVDRYLVDGPGSVASLDEGRYLVHNAQACKEGRTLARV